MSVIEHYFGVAGTPPADADDAFDARYCAQATRDRMAGVPAGRIRAVLRRMAQLAPGAAHSSPRWNTGTGDAIWAGPRLPLAVLGQPKAREGAISIVGPRVGLCAHHGRLYIWADSTLLAPSRDGYSLPLDPSDWVLWRAGSSAGSKSAWIRLEPLPPVEQTGCPDPFGCGTPLGDLLTRFSADLAPPSPEALLAAQAARIELSPGRPQWGEFISPALAERSSGEDAPLQRLQAAVRPQAGHLEPPASVGTSSISPMVTVVHMADEVITAAPAGPSGLPTFDTAFREKPGRQGHFNGLGLYRLLFRESLAAEEFRLIYVGSFLGQQADCFAGDVVASRWWTHVASFTMRDHRIHIALRTAKACGTEPMLQPFRALAHAGLHKDRGCGVGVNRIRFAAAYHHVLSGQPAPSLLRHFRFAYVRLVGPPDIVPSSRPDLCTRVRAAERRVIEQLQPCGNYQVEWPEGSALPPLRVTQDEFRRAAEAALRSAWG